MLPHVDIYEVNASGQPKGTLWRNVVRFSPLQKVEGYSYEDVLINPAAEALKNVLAPDVSVEFSLAGEQGLSVFAFPGSWKDAMARLRTALAGYGSKKHSFGVCFNWVRAAVGWAGAGGEAMNCDRLMWSCWKEASLLVWRDCQSGAGRLQPKLRHALDTLGARPAHAPESSRAPRYSPPCRAQDKVCGCVEPRERDPLLYNRTYVERLGRWKADKSGDKLMGPSVIDVPGTKALLEASGGGGAGAWQAAAHCFRTLVPCITRGRSRLWLSALALIDSNLLPAGRAAASRCTRRAMGAAAAPLLTDFVGVSGYAPMVRPLAFDVMEISWETAAYEFGLFDISLKDLAKSGKKLIYRCG